MAEGGQQLRNESHPHATSIVKLKPLEMGMYK